MVTIIILLDGYNDNEFMHMGIEVLNLCIKVNIFRIAINLYYCFFFIYWAVWFEEIKEILVNKTRVMHRLPLITSHTFKQFPFKVCTIINYWYN